MGNASKRTMCIALLELIEEMKKMEEELKEIKDIITQLSNDVARLRGPGI